MNPDGGPAFPHEGQADYTGGMSLRDWFAGQALAGLVADGGYWEMESARAKSPTEGAFARWAYQFADAMLQERE